MSDHATLDSFQNHSVPSPKTKGDRTIGAMVLTFFGACWLLLACLADSPRHLVAAACLAPIGVVLFATAYTLFRSMRNDARNGPAVARTAQDIEQDAMFTRINIIQWVAGGASVAFLNLIHHPEWILPSIILIVGLHFFPLARLFEVPFYHLVGALLVIISVLLPFFLEDGPQSVILPFATGAVLWSGAVYDILLARARHRG